MFQIRHLFVTRFTFLNKHLAAIAVGFAIMLPAGETLATVPSVTKDAFKRTTEIPYPASNPFSEQKADLGKLLFFDPRLSVDESISCATCHDPEFGWEAPVARMTGINGKLIPRHTPTILNRAFGTSQFWDGRAATLEEQAKGPITDKREMNMTFDELIARLSGVQGYADRFAAVFPGRGITENTIVEAIATFERTVVSGEAPFDRWINGDETAISPSAKRGYELFVGKALCAECHSGWNFTDEEFHDVGLPTRDPGRLKIKRKDKTLRHAFKTPTLRDVALRAPYMHNGSVETLEESIVHYAAGGKQRPSLSKKMKPFKVNDDEIADLVAFMEALTSYDRSFEIPAEFPQ